jgi:hypothetical protein
MRGVGLQVRYRIISISFTHVRELQRLLVTKERALSPSALVFNNISAALLSMAFLKFALGVPMEKMEVWKMENGSLTFGEHLPFADTS